MRSSWLLIQREIRELLRIRTYWVTTGLLAALVAGALVLLPWIQNQSTITRWDVITPSAAQTLTVQRALQSSLAPDHITFEWTTAKHAEVILTITNAKPHLIDDSVQVMVRHGTPPSLSWLQSVLMPAIVNARIDHHPTLLTAWSQITQLPHIVIHRSAAIAPSKPATQIAVVTSFVFILLTILSVYGQMLVSTVSAEKASRISEVLLVRIQPATLLFSKWAGVGIAALLQILSALFAGFLVIVGDPAAQSIVRHWGLSSSPVILWLTIIAAFILSYSLYGGLFIMLGASLGRPEDARSAVGLPTFGLLAAYGGVFYALNRPTQPLTHWIALIPPLFPFMMPILQEFGAATARLWIYGSMLTIVSSVLLLWWAARVNRRTLLSTPTGRHRWNVFRRN
ncbi:MAG: ABC transporter permease [Sulfobacillus sp.]